MRPSLFAIDTALLTSRCVVRRFRENDGAAFHQLISANQDYLKDHFPILVGEIGTTEEKAEIFIRQRIAAWLLQQDYAFGIWLNDSTELIGYVHLFEIDWSIPMAQLSYFIDKGHVQQGLMTEVMARIIRFGFRQLELEKIYLQMLADNYASHRLARRIGFTREGDLRNEFRKPGGMLADLIRFGFTRETYAE